MAFYPDVKKGDEFKPSASLENKVRHFFNGVSTISSGKGGVVLPNNNRIDVINGTNAPISTGTPICITKSVVTDNGLLKLFVAPATKDELKWGIASSTIPAKECGSMILSGIAQAYITGTGDYATPGANGKLVAGTSGKALILHPGDAKTPGIVQLGYSGGAAVDDYTGPFKIIRENETTIAVVNGSAPNFEYCGNTDLPGAENVAKKTFAFEGKEIRIYLHACHNNGVYSTVLAKRGETVAGSFDSRLIGIVYSNGTIQQTRFDSYQIIYRNDYYL